MSNRPDQDGVGEAALDTGAHTSPVRQNRLRADEELVTLWWVCRVLISTLFGTVPFGYAGFEQGEQPLLLLGGICLVAGVGIGASFLISRRRGRVGRAPIVALALILVAYLAAIFLLHGLDLVIVVGGVVTFAAVTYLLRQGWLAALVASGLLTAGAIADRYLLPFAQYDIGFEPTGMAILAMIFAVQVLALAFVVIRRARDASISRRLLLTFASVTLLPGVVIAGTSFIFGYGASKTRRFGELNSAVISRESRVTDWAASLGDDLGVLRLLYTPMLQELALSEPGSQAYHDNREASLAQLTDAVSLHKRFDALQFYGVEGQLVLSTVPQQGRQDLGDPQALESGVAGTYVGPFVVSGVLGEKAVTVAAPVLGDAGAPLGILVGQATARDLRWIMAATADIAEDVEMYVVDGEGQLMTGPANPGGSRRAVQSEGIDAMLRSGGRVEQIGENYAETSVLGVYQWLPSMGIGLIAEVDTASLSEATRGILIGILAISLASIAIAVFVSTTITGEITTPLADVAEASARIAEGDFETVVPVAGRDELGQLAESVNRMSARLRDLVGGLEERVAARTADLARRSVQLETAARVARQAASVRDTDALLQVAVDQIAEQFGLYHVGLHLVNDASRSVMLRASSAGGGKVLLAGGLRMDLAGRGIIADAARTGQPILVPDVVRDARYLPLPELAGTRSEISLPLRIRDQIIGVLDVQSDEAGYFTREDVATLQTMADQIALALENAGLLEEAEERLREIGRLVAVQQQTGWQQLAAARPNWAYISDGVSARPIADAARRIDDPDLVLPLGAAELEFGQVRVQRRGGEEITSEQAALARAIAEETSQALERARLFRDTQDTLIEVGTLYRSSRAIIDAQSPQGVLEAVVENVAAPELDQMILLTLERSPSAQTWLNVAAVVDRSDEVSGLMGRRWSATALPGLDEITDDLVVFGNGMARGAEHASTGRALLTELGLQAALVAPLSVGPRRVGWLVAGASAQPYAFSDRERRLYGGLTDLAAAVVRNFQLLDLAEGRAARAQALSVISGRMRETLDMDLILQTTLREIGEKLGISNIEVRMRGGGR